MPVLTGSLTQGLALVDVEFGVDPATVRALLHSGLQPPAPVRTSGILDTGTTVTCIDPSIRQALSLTAINTIGIGTPFGAPGGQTCDQFKVSLTLKHSGGSPTADLSEPMLTVVEVPLAHLGSDLLVLIGADMLARCQLHYDGPAATFSLQY